MGQYISKSALVAEIEKRIEEYKAMKIDSSYYKGMIAALEFLRDEFINTLEVKEVDLETELKQWWNNHYSKNYPFDAYVGHYLENSTVIEIAKHFFELGLKVSQKGEDVDAQINSQNETIKQLNSALNSMEHNGHLPKMMTAAESLGIPQEEYDKIEDELFEEQEEPKKDFRERYKHIAESESFKKAYEGMGIGEVIPVEGEEPVSEDFKQLKL